MFENIPEDYNRKTIPKMMQDASIMKFVFNEGYYKIKEYDKVLEGIKKNTLGWNIDKDVKGVYQLLCNLTQIQLGIQKLHWDYIEALTMNQIELRKDNNKLTNSIKKTKHNEKTITKLQNKMKQHEEDLKEFRTSEKYLKFTKRFWDERTVHNEDD